MSRKNKKHVVPNPFRPNIWGFLTKVLVSALDKGQLLPMFLGLFILIIIFKIPNNEIVSFISELTNISNFNSILGWILAGFTTFGGFLTVKWKTKIHNKEINRISKEKKLLQEKMVNKQLPTTKDN